MESTFDHIDELIGKHLAGEATREEQAVVEKWVAGSEDNRRYYNQMKIVFEKAAVVKDREEFDTDAAWINLKQRLHQAPGNTIPLNSRKQFSMYWKVAASILIVLSVGYGAFRLTQRQVEPIVISAGSEAMQDTLPDGSVTFLNKQSTVAYTYSSGKPVRSVTLKGEAFFDVKHTEEKPFIIETEDVIIEDIGTTFNVKAYPESPTVEVFVETGEVAFYTAQHPGIRLTEGETGVYHKASRTFEKTRSDTNVLAYKTRVFNFYNVDLGTIVESLNDVYETKLRLANPALESCRINVSFKGEPIEVIAEIIAETLNFNLSKSDNEIVLDGSGCGE